MNTSKSDKPKSNKPGSNKPKSNKLWGGRFTGSTDEFVQSFTASVMFDQRMAQQDISCSKAHAKMLGRVGVLSQDDVDAILRLSLIHI